MYRRIIVVMSALVFLGCTAAIAEEVYFNNETCPVMNGPVDGTNTVLYNGIRYNVCCPQCIETFTKNPESFLSKLPQQGLIVDAHNDLCPVMAGPASDEYSYVFNGVRIHFCCPACIEQFKADPLTYSKKLTLE